MLLDTFGELDIYNEEVRFLNVKEPDRAEIIKHLQTENILVLKTKGGTYWTRIGCREYSGGEYSVIRYSKTPYKNDPSINRIKCIEVIVEFPVRKAKK